MPGRLITIEGIEGVGKTTQIALIADFLRTQQIKVVCTREPGGTPLAENIRQLLLTPRDEKIAVDTELLLLCASRAQHVAEVILPALSRGEWVLCDRFVDATYAYQGGGRGIDVKRIDALMQWTLGKLSVDLTILLDAPYKIGEARAKQRGGQPDRFESEKEVFFNAVRDAYLQRAKQEPKRIKVIDANQSIDAVQSQIQHYLKTVV